MTKALAKVIPGEPIPGDDLGPVEAPQIWSELQKRARTMLGQAEDFSLALAEWWDRGGARHMKWGANAAAYVSGVLGCNKSRVYQLISYGRAKWHLSTAVDKPTVDGLTEWALRPALKSEPGIVAEVIELAKEIAVKDEKAKAERYGRPVSDLVKINHSHVREAMKAVVPQPRVYRQDQVHEMKQLTEEPHFMMRAVVGELRGIATRVDNLYRRVGDRSLQQLHKKILAVVESADSVRKGLEDHDLIAS